MNRKELAVELHQKRFNCAQAVACAFSDVTEYDRAAIFKMSEAFGGGMGAQNTCGAVSAMAMVIGMKASDGNMDQPATKAQCYRLMKKATQMFEEKNKSTICREIKGLTGGPVLRSCDGCIEDAVSILEELLPDMTAAENQ